MRAPYRLRTLDAIQRAAGLKSLTTLAITKDEAWTQITGSETPLLTDVRSKR